MSDFGNVILTQKGMDFVTSAHNKGIYIDLRYFVPAYDNRIDSNVRLSGYNLSSFSQVASETRITNEPVGEILWKRSNPYDLDISNKFIISASTFAGDVLQNSFQRGTVPTNLYLNQPISDQVSANTWSVSGAFGKYNFTANPSGTGVVGLGNARPTSTCADWFSTGDYYPVYNTAALENLRGSWKCLLHQSTVGNIYFNKILLYAVAVQQDNPNVTVDECLFGEAYIQTSIVISNLGTGFDNIEIDVQIDISGTSANFEQLFYSSSADYWSHSPGGLYFPNRIGVGSFEDNQASISATMHLRRARSSIGVPDDSIPVLRMDYDNSRFFSLDVSETPYDINSPFDDFMGTTPDHLSGSDIIIKVANWENYEGGYSNAIAFRPKVPSTVVLGTSAYPFRELILNNKRYTGTYELPDRVDETKLKNIIPLRITNEFANYAVSINNGQVYIGNISGSFINVSDPFGIKISGIGIDITDEFETESFNGYGSFKGGDLIRYGQNLLIFNEFYKAGNDEFGGDYGVENLYIFAGLQANADFTSVDGQVGSTHKNIIYAIEQDTIGLFNGQDKKLANTAEIHLAAKGKIGLHGPIEIQNLSEYADGSTTATQNAIIISRYPENNMLIGVGLSSTSNFNIMIDRMDNKDTFYDLRSSDFSATSLFLAADNIYVDGSILPLLGNISLGSANKYFSRMYAVNANIPYLTVERTANIDTVQANLIISNDGYYEHNRPVKMGEWTNINAVVYQIANLGTRLKDLLNGVTHASFGLSANDITLTFSAAYYNPLSINSELYNIYNLSQEYYFSSEDVLSWLLEKFNDFLNNIWIKWRFFHSYQCSLNSNDGYLEITNPDQGILSTNKISFSILYNGKSILTWEHSYKSGQSIYIAITVPQSYTKIGDTFFVYGSCSGNNNQTMFINCSDELKRNGNDFLVGTVANANGISLSNTYVSCVPDNLTQFELGRSSNANEIFAENTTYYYNLIYRGQTEL